MTRPFYIWKLSLVLFSDESRLLSTNLKWTWMWNCNREGWSLDHFSANTSLWGKEKVAWWLRTFHAKGNMYDELHGIHNWPTVRTISLEKLVAADGAIVNFPLLHLGVASNFLWFIHLRLVVWSMVSFYERCRTLVSSLRATRAWGLFLESLENFSTRKASCPSANRLFWKADLLTCFNCKKNQEDCEFWWLRTLALQRYKGNCDTRNRPDKFWDLRETGPWLLRGL